MARNKKASASRSAPKSSVPRPEQGWEDVPSVPRLEFMTLSEEGECHVLLGECREIATKYGPRTVQSAQLCTPYTDADGVVRGVGDIVGIFHSADLHRLKPLQGREVRIAFAGIEPDTDKRLYTVRAKKA